MKNNFVEVITYHSLAFLALYGLYLILLSTLHNTDFS